MSIDTNTTAGKIAVMQAFEDGKTIDSIKLDIENKWKVTTYPTWSWHTYDYRIKPQTVEEAAEEDFNQSSWMTDDPKFIYQSGATFGAQWQKDQDQ